MPGERRGHDSNTPVAVAETIEQLGRGRRALEISARLPPRLSRQVDNVGGNDGKYPLVH